MPLGPAAKMIKTTGKVTPLDLHCTTVSVGQGYTPGPQRRCWVIQETPPTIHLLPVLCRKVAPLDNRHRGKSSPQKWHDTNQYLLINKATAQEKDPKRQGLADGQMDRLMDPRTDETKLISRIWIPATQGPNNVPMIP